MSASSDVGVPSTRRTAGSLKPSGVGSSPSSRRRLTRQEPNADELALSARVLDLAWRRHGLMDSTAEVDDDLRVQYEAALQGAKDDTMGD